MYQRTPSSGTSQTPSAPQPLLLQWVQLDALLGDSVLAIPPTSWPQKPMVFRRFGARLPGLYMLLIFAKSLQCVQTCNFSNTTETQRGPKFKIWSQQPSSSQISRLSSSCRCTKHGMPDPVPAAPGARLQWLFRASIFFYWLSSGICDNESYPHLGASDHK